MEPPLSLFSTFALDPKTLKRQCPFVLSVYSVASLCLEVMSPANSQFAFIYLYIYVYFFSRKAVSQGGEHLSLVMQTMQITGFAFHTFQHRRHRSSCPTAATYHWTKCNCSQGLPVNLQSGIVQLQNQPQKIDDHL